MEESSFLKVKYRSTNIKVKDKIAINVYMYK